jgi:prophage antirepressor-like protein
VAKDVCAVLGLKNHIDAISVLDEDEKSGVEISDPHGRKQYTNIISESGLYTLIMRSNKPEAHKFRKWVTQEVLPTIRKHGAYLTPETLSEMLAKPENAIKLFQALKEERDARVALEEKVKLDAPKVQFAEGVAGSKNSVLVREVAKCAKQIGLPYGGTRLWNKLRDWNYIVKNSTEPTQQAIEAGWFEIKETLISSATNGSLTKFTTKVTGKGQIHIIVRLCKEHGIQPPQLPLNFAE